MLWKYLLLKVKYIFLRESYVCTRCIFIFDSDQAQINSVGMGMNKIHFINMGFKKDVWAIF
jgi:hypothetical protein